MDRTVSGPHELVNPPGMLSPLGFSHAVVAAGGRTVYLAGQTGHRADGTLAGETLVEQFDQALQNVAAALMAAGGRPEHLVRVHIYVTDAADYRGRLSALGESWRRHLGVHYPAVALFEVNGLFDPDARVELVGTAVVTGA
ncbi:MAG TPA: RidA family protein [Actinomycetota bacterium]|jgi:enamine deaminase RidA (YjgF/YER057c/UK114 family)